MGWFGDGQSSLKALFQGLLLMNSLDSDQAQANQQFQDEDNKPKLSHEIVAGAAAYYAADKYEEHCEANGKFPSYKSLHYRQTYTTLCHSLI